MTRYESYADEYWPDDGDQPFYVINIVPGFGPVHEFHEKCWCHPDVERYSGGDIIIHNVVH